MSRALGLKVVTNAAALIGGRGLIALGRLVIAGLIARRFGTGSFADYAVLFGVLSIAEWVADFGTTETFVREAARPAADRGRLVGALIRLKVVQVPLALLALVSILLLMRYPAPMVEAGLAGGAGILFFGGVLVYRAVFRTTLTMEREVGAELVSVAAMVPMVALAASRGGGLTALLLCHAASRAVFFAAVALLGRGQLRPRRANTLLAADFRAAAPIGTIGILVAIYEAIDLLVLSKLATVSEVAGYSAAQRLIWPVLIGLGAVGQTIYPVAAAAFARGRQGFDTICQRGVEAVLILASIPLCSLLAAPAFFLGLIGPGLAGGAPLLRLLALLCFVKAISATVGPLLYAVGAQERALRFIAAAVVAKLAFVVALTLALGAVGAALGALLAEIAFAAVPSLVVLARAGGVALRWSVPARVVALALAAALVSALAFPAGGAAAAIAPPLLFLCAGLAARLVRLAELQALLRWRTS